MKDKHERGRRHAGEMVEMLQRVARLEQSEARQDAGQELPVESEEEYRVLFTEARDGIVLIDCEAGRIVDCNPEFEAQTGRPLDELKRMEVWELGPTEKMGTVRQSFLKIREDGIGGSREWQFQRPDGEVVPVDFLSKVVTIGDKQYVQGTARDITEHKWSEETRETVNLVARLFMTSRTSEAFYQELPRMLSARFGFPSVAVRLSDMETRKMRFVGWTGPGPGVSRSPQAPVDNVISDTNGGTIQDPPPSGERAVSTVLCVPMKVGEHILGALSLADTRQRRVPPTLIDAIQVVADYVAQIIERQQVDERLTLLSNALRMTTDGIIISDTGGRILEVNEGAAKMYGAERREDLVGKNCFDFIPPEEQGRVLARFEELLDDGYVKNLEHHIITRGGSRIPVEMSAVIRRDAHGRPTGFVGIARDITERKEARRALEESEEKYRNLVERMNDVIYTLDTAGNITSANKALEKVFGFKPEEIIGRNILEFVEEDVLSEVMEALEESRGGKPVTGETVMIDKKGRPHDVEFSSASMIEDGDIVGTQGIVRDVTERKKAERALREAVEKFRTVFEGATEGIIAADINTKKFVFANPRICEITGYSLEELLDMDVSKIHPKSDLARVMEEFTGQVEGRITLAEDIPVLRKDKEIVYCDINSRAITIGEHELLLGFFRDITERKKAREEKKRMAAHLRRSQKMEALGRLAGGVAHDFNNLLTTMRGYCDLGLMKTQEDGAVPSCLRNIRDACIRAANLTRQLLLFSRRQPVALRPLDLNKVVLDLVKMLERLLGEKFPVVTDLAPDLWTSNADAGHIEQIIMDMVLNAKDVMPEGGEVTITTRNFHADEGYCRIQKNARPGKYICLSVKDNGVGMDSETMSRVFEPFFTTEGLGKRTGLGLSVAYGISRQHGGWIDVESTPGKGSVFRVYIPSTSEGPKEERTDVGCVAAAKGRGERILVVEDQGDVRELAGSLLSENGYVVFAAKDAKEAVDVFAREGGRLDLVFSDVVLPDENGVKLVERLKEGNPKLRVLLASGYSGEMVDGQAIKEKGYAFLQKPYVFTDLLQTIRELLEKN